MNRDLRTRTHDMKKHGKNTKDGAEPKLCAGELRRDNRKWNRLKGEKVV